MRRLWAAGLTLALGWAPTVSAGDGWRPIGPAVSLGRPVVRTHSDTPPPPRPSKPDCILCAFNPPPEPPPPPRPTGPHEVWGGVWRTPEKPTPAPADEPSAIVPAQSVEDLPLPREEPPATTGFAVVSADTSWGGPVTETVSAESVFEEPPLGCWFQAEYLLWFLKDSRYPVLAATADPTGQNVQSLFGGDVHNHPRSGARFAGGYWLDDYESLGGEVSGFFLAERASRFNVGAGTPVIVRPFTDANASQHSSPERLVFVSRPGSLDGRLSIDAPSRMWGIEVNGRGVVCNEPGCRVELISGLRYLDLEEGLRIVDQRDVIGGENPDLIGSTLVVRDNFDTRNRFLGGQFGTAAKLRYQNWTLDLTGKVGIGGTRQTVSVAGSTSVNPPLSGFTTQPSGLLALDSNSGKSSRSRFAAVPELGVNIGYAFTPNCRVWAGYNLLYWCNVVRPGQQIDTTLSPRRIPALARQIIIPGPSLTAPSQPRPAPLFNDTSFWAQGLNFGLELRY